VRRDVEVTTLQELDGSEWPEPDEGASRLVHRCHELRREQINDLALEDLRLLIGQSIGLPWLVPLALDELEANPLASGDLYDGDLFAALIGLPESYWANDTPSWLRLRGVAEALAVAGERAASWLSQTRGGA
jgi:hypothetical protein